MVRWAVVFGGSSYWPLIGQNFCPLTPNPIPFPPSLTKSLNKLVSLDSFPTWLLRIPHLTTR